MNLKPYFGEYSQNWYIKTECIETMIESFKKGTQFVVNIYQMCSKPINEIFEGWIQLDTTHSVSYRIRVSNDERRRLLPILTRLNKMR
jgi:hypothetical protein